MMTEHEPTVIDKSTWGDGPWQTEPDRVEWTHAGFPCLALRASFGHWCGYVAVPPGHPWYGTSYGIPNVDVHGGLTYNGACQGAICHVPAPGEPDNVWWFGFDCGHAGDFSPAMHARFLDWGPPFDGQPYDHVKAIAADSWVVDCYRTLAYVQAETNRLAEQFAEVKALGT